MKYMGMLGLAAATAMALVAFGAGTASATTLTSPTGTVYKGEVVASAETTVTLKEEAFGTKTCTTSVIKFTPNAQSEATTVTGAVSTLTFGTPRVVGGNEEESHCENGAATINVLKTGSLEIHSIAGTENGTLTSSGMEVTTLKFGIHCIYTTNNTHLGTITGGKTATIDINAKMNKGPTSPFCAEHSTWEGSYWVTTPDELFIS